MGPGAGNMLATIWGLAWWGNRLVTIWVLVAINGIVTVWCLVGSWACDNMVIGL